MTEKASQRVKELLGRHPFDMLDTIKQLESGYANFCTGGKQYVWQRIDTDFIHGMRDAYRPNLPAYGCYVFDDENFDEMVFETDGTFHARLKKFRAEIEEVAALLPQPIAEEVVPEIFRDDIMEILTIISAPSSEKMAAWGLAIRPPEPDAWDAVSGSPV